MKTWELPKVYNLSVKKTKVNDTNKYYQKKPKISGSYIGCSDIYNNGICDSDCSIYDS